MDKIDFRSDTVTWPTDAMRTAMANAPLGDDVYGEDPSVNALEKLAAHKLGFEAALFTSSGTMGNLISILTHANRGDEAIVGEDNHTYVYEAGGMATLGGILPRVLPMDEIGRMDLDRVRKSVSPDNVHFANPKLILTENTVGGRYGAVLPNDYLAGLRTIADDNGLILHLDGARLFNAAVKQNIDVREITKHVHSTSVCLSKGLGAPVGTVIAGSGEFIKKARRARKMVGGGMRQAGMLAAAGIVGLNEMVERMSDDHDHARLLAEGLAEIPGIYIDLDRVHTNMAFFGLDESVSMTTAEFADQMREQSNIWINGGGNLIRTVTHYWITKTEIDIFLSTARHILSAETV